MQQICKGKIFSNENILFNINDQLFLEILVMVIGCQTIKYSSIKKKKTLKEERKLEEAIKNFGS